MKVSDKVVVLRALLERVRTNARGRASVGPPSSRRAMPTDGGGPGSLHAMAPPPDEDRWDLAPAELDALANEAPSTSEPPAQDGGVMLDLGPVELPEIQPRESVPPLTPPQPSRLRAVESAANADPEALRFWLSALTTPKSSPPASRDAIPTLEAPSPDEPPNDPARFISTQPADPPSRRVETQRSEDEVPLAPRMPHWSEPASRATPAPPSNSLADTSSPGLVAPMSERAARVTGGPLSRRRSARLRPRTLTRGATEAKKSRWLRGAVAVAGGAAIGIVLLRLLNPRPLPLETSRQAESSTALAATGDATAGVATAPSGSLPRSVAHPPLGSPSAPVAQPPAPPTADSEPDPIGTPAPDLPEDKGRLTVRSTARVAVYVNGVRAGMTNVPLAIPCGLKHVRLADSRLPPPGKSFPIWISEGVSVLVPCRAAAEIELETQP